MPRRGASRAPSVLTAFAPTKSRSVTKKIFSCGALNPNLITEVVTCATFGEKSAKSSINFIGISASFSKFAYLSAVPCPIAAITTCHPALTFSLICKVNRSIFPLIGSIASNSANSEFSPSIPKGATEPILKLRFSKAIKTSFNSIKELPPNSIGTVFPCAAFSQDASKNSRPVEINSPALEFIRSGETKITLEFFGSISVRDSMESTNAGIKDSIPSAAIPVAIFPNRSEIPGYFSTNAPARFFTSSVNAISRLGSAITDPAINAIVL